MNRKAVFCLFKAACLVFLSGFFFTVDARESATLVLNAPVSRDFKSGERHTFNVSARENEIIEIICERRGVDSSLAAFAPNGEKISVSNSPGGFAGFDRLLFAAEKTGEYRIELESRRPGNIVGSYTILLKNQQPAGENDATRARAMQLLGAARMNLFGQENRLGKAEEALEKLEKALDLFEETKDLQGQADTLFHIANVKGYEFGDKAKAIELYEKALAIWSKIDDEAGRAICLMYLADEIRDYDNPKKPREYYTGKAEGYFDEALAINRKINNKSDEATALAYLCRLYNDTQNFQKGFEACRESLRIGGNSDPLTDYRAYGNLASLYGNSGDLETALKYNQTALERLEIVKDYLNPFRRAFIKSNIGGLLAAQKKYPEAEQNLREALTITEQVRRKLYSGYILVRLGSIYYETNRLAEALETAQKGVEYYREIDPVKIQAALLGLGKIQLALGQINSARALYSEAVEINRRNKDRYAEAESLYLSAKLENQAGNLDTARQDIELAISNSEVIRAQLLGRNQRTTYLSILKKYYELEIELLVKLHEKNADPRFLEQAWQTHEKIRARSLLENLIESGLNLSEFAPKDFFAKEQVLLEAIAAAELKRTEALRANNPARQKAAETDLHKKLDEYQVLQENFRRTNPQFSAINQPKAPSLAEARSLLDEDTAILEFALGEQQSYVWVICKNAFKLAKLPPKTAVNQEVREFYRALTDREAKNDKAVIEKSKSLSRAILSPAAGGLRDIKQIIVIADGALQLIPFSALTFAPDSADYRPVAATIEVVNAPSFSSLVLQHENKAGRQKTSDQLLAVFADPIFQDDDERFSIDKPANPKNPSNPKDISENLTQALRDFGLEKLGRLPFSGMEAQAIGQFAPEQTFLALGADASRQNFLSGNFNSYRILHFATHGFLNQQNPELSGLVLSLYDREGKAQNGFLRVIDLYSLHLNSDLVVLSACQTALGKEIDGEGIVGLTRGFMYAGAAGVVSSLWKVEDAATAELMKKFYRAMLKDNQTPSAALRTAQNQLRQIPRFRNPRHWAGFTLNGKWR
jgi:CHAT domain-containing protein/Tfp pilus assembly protein PilF